MVKILTLVTTTIQTIQLCFKKFRHIGTHTNDMGLSTMVMPMWLYVYCIVSTYM